MRKKGGNFSSQLFADSENEVGDTQHRRDGIRKRMNPKLKKATQAKSLVTLQTKHTSPRGTAPGISAIVLCVECLPFLILEASVGSDRKHFAIVPCGGAECSRRKSAVGSLTTCAPAPDLPLPRCVPWTRLCLPEPGSALYAWVIVPAACHSHEQPHNHEALLAVTIISCTVCPPSGGNEKPVQLPLKMPNFPPSLRPFI